MIITVKIIISTLASVISLAAIFAITMRGKNGKLMKSYVANFYIMFIYASGDLLQVIAFANYDLIDQHNMIYLFDFIFRYKYLSLSFGSAVSLLFCFNYSLKTLTYFERKLYQKRWIFFISGMICFAFVLTNNYHYLITYWWTENGITLFYLGAAARVFSVIDVIYTSFGCMLILRHALKSYPYYRKQALIVIPAGFLPSIISFIYFNSSLYQATQNFDIFPATTFITLPFASIVLLKFRFLNITPIAFHKMADNLKESILVVDANGEITYFNRSFKDTFHECLSLSFDMEIANFTDYLKNEIIPGSDTAKIIEAIESVLEVKISGEIILKDLRKYFTVDIQPLLAKKDFVGQIITFYDITDYRNLLLSLENKNLELESANIKIRENALAGEQLAAERERNRLVGDVHDSVGHTMTVLISLIGVCSLACEKDDMETVRQKLNEMMNVSLNGHRELKRSVNGILTQEKTGIVYSLNSLIQDFKKTGVEVDFVVSGDESKEASIHETVIHKICKESLTNSLRHGRATVVNILLKFSEELVSLYIFDNGIGCKEIKKNVGLRFMEKRVLESGGSISFGSDGEKGFNTHVKIPLKALHDMRIMA
ncbi:MAG TPA: histidine kinase N-terminal 7TM domain-containing protein [Clostridia bacterium]